MGVTAVAFVVSAIAHFALGVAETRTDRGTDNARQAAALMERIRIRKGSDLMALRTGLTVTNGAAVVLVIGALLSILTPEIGLAPRYTSSSARMLSRPARQPMTTPASA